MSNIVDVTLQNVILSMADETLDVFSGASLSLSGWSNQVILESGSGNFSLSGTNNTVSGAAANGITATVSGSGNIVAMGANDYVDDMRGTGDAITAGAGSIVVGGINTTVNALGGGVDVETEMGNGDIVNGNNDLVRLAGDTASVSGNSNQILMEGGTLNLDGSNNAISFSTNSGSNEVQTASGYFVEETADGSFYYSVSSFHYLNSVLTLGLGQGNFVTITDVNAGSIPNLSPANGQLNHLTAAMAVYSCGTNGECAPVTSQMLMTSPVFTSAHQQA